MCGTCCGPPAAAPEPVGTPTAPSIEINSDVDSCCDGDGTGSLPDEAQSHAGVQAVNLDDCCSAGSCKDTAPKDQADAPDCCRDKVGPCCDASCIDRLAMRECSINSAASSSDPGRRSNACDGSTEHKACAQHSLSALDRYGATLQALGCICRSLIALGQETCCEIRERHSPSGKQCSKKSSAQSLLRKSMDSGSSTGSLARSQAAKNHLRQKRDSSESTRSSKKRASPRATSSCCKRKSPTKTDIESKCSKPCCSGRKNNTAPSGKVGCGELLCSDGKNVEEPVGCAENQDPCCSKTLHDQEPAAPSGCSKSCCAKDDGIIDNGPSYIVPGSCRAKTPSSSAGCTGGAAESCCGPAKKVVDKAPSKPTCSSSCCESPKVDTAKGPEPSARESCCTEKSQLVSAQDSCADACCSSPPQDPGLEIKEAPLQAISDLENQANGNEHVVLSISGMTCTGCETKLNRTLATVPAVKDLKTSLVLSRAEFNIDLRLGSVEEVVKHLERTTEFKCERVQNKGSSLDLIVPDDAAKLVGQAWPDGVFDITILDKQTVRVAFDPKILGARDLIEKHWDTPIQLAPPRGDPSLEAGSKHVRNVGYMTLLSAVLTIPVLVLAWAPLPEREVAYSSASLALATIVQVVIAGPFYPKALKALVFSRVIEMDLLIVLSTSVAYIFSVVSFGYLVAKKPLSTGQFFETSTLLVTLIMVGRWVAALARQKAVESISIRSLQSPTATLVDKDGNVERDIDARLLQYGDTFKVLPDTRIPTDGTVITGSSEVDESMVTGESRPVEKYPKSVVIAGSINGNGAMTVRLNRLPGDNTLNAIAAMVDEAKLSKPKLQDLADRVASYFVPVVVALTIITFVIWVAVGMTVRGYNGSEATIQAITYAITVLIVSCPCAIGLAVPMVIVIVSGVAAEKGIVFKSADAIEVAHKTSHVVFDKTGTLTRGKLSVVAKDSVNVEALSLLLGLIENSRHPVSVSVATHLKDNGVASLAVADPKSLTGKGLEAMVNGQKLRAGNSRWLNLSQNEFVQPMLAQGYTVFCFTVDDALHAVYGLEDELRSDAVETVQTLQKTGVTVHIVSGDDDGAVQSLGSALSIPSSNMRSRSSPSDKKEYIQTLLGTGNNRKKPVVVFCGDGTNDAVALAQATIGVHMNEGTDVAQSAADVVLMRPALAGILTMMNASRQAVNRIKFNFLWSFVYNTFAVLLAAGAFVNARIPPKFAGLGELVSVLPVIAAAVLLRWSKI
ncbi:hypothetical protein N7541_002867 [Penicillium brevicompactum]|uniref:HMA domain-containing protein n=1 Tax=Penicillium brevicompactum TaxID=5074 RepID=A0A9W9RQN5_PENBR|nr:hypothetical protein N7541_002867 [Penicillium brevicompactum]